MKKPTKKTTKPTATNVRQAPNTLKPVEAAVPGYEVRKSARLLAALLSLFVDNPAVKAARAFMQSGIDKRDGKPGMSLEETKAVLDTVVASNETADDGQPVMFIKTKAATKDAMAFIIHGRHSAYGALSCGVGAMRTSHAFTIQVSEDGKKAEIKLLGKDHKTPFGTGVLLAMSTLKQDFKLPDLALGAVHFVDKLEKPDDILLPPL